MAGHFSARIFNPLESKSHIVNASPIETTKYFIIDFFFLHHLLGHSLIKFYISFYIEQRKFSCASISEVQSFDLDTEKMLKQTNNYFEKCVKFPCKYYYNKANL